MCPQRCGSESRAEKVLATASIDHTSHFCLLACSQTCKVHKFQGCSVMSACGSSMLKKVKVEISHWNLLTAADTGSRSLCLLKMHLRPVCKQGFLKRRPAQQPILESSTDSSVGNKWRQQTALWACFLLVHSLLRLQTELWARFLLVDSLLYSFLHWSGTNWKLFFGLNVNKGMETFF